MFLIQSKGGGTVKINKYKLKRQTTAWTLAILRTIFFLGIGFYILYPIFTKSMMALMAERDLYDATVSLVPKNWTLDNVKIVFESMDYKNAFFNTVILSLMVMILQLVSSLLVGYGFGRFDFPFKNVIFACGLFMLMVPPQTFIIPLYLSYSNFDIFGIFKLISGQHLNLLNTHWPFILSSLFCTGTKGMVFVYMFRQYFRGMPKEIEEAARVDGANEFRTFWQVMAPSSKPIAVCVILLSFVWQWNDIQYTGWYMSEYSLLSVNLYALEGLYKSATGYTGVISPGFMALLNGTGVMLLIIPLLILYLIMQKNFVQSVERSGIVG